MLALVATLILSATANAKTAAPIEGVTFEADDVITTDAPTMTIVDLKGHSVVRDRDLKLACDEISANYISAEPSFTIEGHRHCSIVQGKASAEANNITLRRATAANNWTITPPLPKPAKPAATPAKKR